MISCSLGQHCDMVLPGAVAVEFTEIGPVDLKGVSQATRLYVARRRS